MLASISSYNYRFKFRQACRKRYGTSVHGSLIIKNSMTGSMMMKHPYSGAMVSVSTSFILIFGLRRRNANLYQPARGKTVLTYVDPRRAQIVYRLIPSQRKHYWCLVESQTGKVPVRRLLFLSA